MYGWFKKYSSSILNSNVLFIYLHKYCGYVRSRLAISQASKPVKEEDQQNNMGEKQKEALEQEEEEGDLTSSLHKRIETDPVRKSENANYNR